MATLERSINVLINSRFVVEEVRIHSEGGYHGTVGHQLQLDLVHVLLDGVSLLAVCFVLREFLNT